MVTKSRYNTVCAVLVTYYPDNNLYTRLKTLLSQVDALIIVDNTPTEKQQPRLPDFVDNKKVHMVMNHANKGIATALNQGLEIAAEIGHKWILTLDQDSQCYPDMVQALTKTYDICKPKAAIIGSNYFDRHKGQHNIQTSPEKACIDRKTVITSGCLVDVAVALDIGGFREDYFIDQVDHEFCLRARSKGYRVVMSAKPTMTHSVGAEGGVKIPLLGAFPDHSALRKYYIARNSLVTISQYWYREPVWCFLRIVRLMLGLAFMATLEKQRIAKVSAFMSGVTDAVRMKMGKYHEQ